MSFDKIYDVLIVGAGPVGLASAIALRQRGINNILVIDQTRSFRQVGQVVDILPNGLKALKCIDENAYQQIKSAGLEFILARRHNSKDSQKEETKKRVWCQKNLQGEIVRSTPLDFDYWCDRYGEGRVSISWYRLQTELRNLLPEAMVQVDRRCVSIAQSADLVTVNCVSNYRISSNPFAHWEQAADKKAENTNFDRLSEHQFQARLVVAADGINSTVRQLVYHDSDLSSWAKPQYSGSSAIGCMQIDDVPDEIMRQLKKYFQGDMVVTLRNDAGDVAPQSIESPRLILIRRAKNSLGYLLHSVLDISLIQNKSPEVIINLAADILTKANFPAVFTQVIKLSNPAKLIHRPYYIHSVNISSDRPIWSNERLVLVGDAAHGMPPFAAQGANQGLEDAAIIGTAIANIVKHNRLGDRAVIRDLFSKYEQLRRPLIAKVQEATMHNHHWSQEKWENYSNEVYRHDVNNLNRKLVVN